MKKLKLSLLDMKGAEMLNRQQLKNVMGGTGYPPSGSGFCNIHTYNQDGVEIESYGIFTPPCPDASAAGNTHCVNLIITPGNGVYRCTYNCNCS